MTMLRDRDHHAYDDNYAALVLSIVKDVSPERSFILMHGTHAQRKKQVFSSEEDVIRMIDLKKQHSYEEVGKIFGISGNAVYCKIRKYQARKAAVTNG